jgi:hypothetical protein
VLDVVVAVYGQAQAALQAATLEDLAAVGGGHALAKAMHTHASADLGLIRTFGCHSLTPNKTGYLPPASKREPVVFSSLPLRKTLFTVYRSQQTNTKRRFPAGVFQSEAEL